MAILPFDPFASGSPTPPPPPPIDPLAPPDVLPLADEGKGSRSYWKNELVASDERLDTVREDWKANLLAYRAKSLRGEPTVDTVVVPLDFGYVEQKIAQIFFQVPEVHLTALRDDLEDPIQVFQAVINQLLSADGLDALATMKEVVFDLLCPAGLMCGVVGYENFINGTSDVQVGEQVDPAHQPMPSLGQPDPTQLPGSVLGIGTPAPAPPMVPVTQPMPNIVHQRYYFSRVSPTCLRLPAEWTGSVYDRAPWLGYVAEDDWDVIRKRYHLPEGMTKPSSRGVDDEKMRLPGEAPQTRSGRGAPDRVKYTVIWYRTAFIDPAEAHPEKFRLLILADGLETPLVHRDSPYQSIHPQTGELLGLRGNPIHVGSVRYVSDSALPPSECSIFRATADEINKSRTQMLLTRDRARPMRLVDLTRIGGEAGLDKLRQNQDQAFVPVDHLDASNPIVQPIGLAAYPQQDFAFESVLNRTADTIWAMGANQRGQQSSSRTTATEIAKIDQWAETRLDAERRATLGYFIRFVRKLAALVQLFSDEPAFVMVVGADKASRLRLWDKSTIAGEFAFTASPDSAVRVDQAQARTESLKLYELLRKDPNVNGVALLHHICHEWNLDPKSFVIDQLPPKPPEPAKIGFSFNATDVDVNNPSFPIYAAILQQSGYQIPPELIQAARDHAAHQAQILAMGQTGQPPLTPPPSPRIPGVHDQAPPPPYRPHEHGGTQPTADHVNRHRGDESTRPAGTPPLLHDVGDRLQ